MILLMISIYNIYIVYSIGIAADITKTVVFCLKLIL